MGTHASRVPLLGLILAGLLACSAPSNNGQPVPPTEEKLSPAQESPRDVNQLLGRIWRVSNSPYGVASGAIYVFFPNGTLLETSCVETYRIATWKADEKDSRVLNVIEDRRPAFTATVNEVEGNTLHLTQKLLQGKGESRELTLTSVDKEFVCPDLPK